MLLFTAAWPAVPSALNSAAKGAHFLSLYGYAPKVTAALRGEQRAEFDGVQSVMGAGGASSGLVRAVSGE
ncbi:hypothetical protein ACI1MP_37310 (plasmid) [Kitasatospora griseola]|uniref:hypothetical protein n=1 Tax=Kitasatospora griseola TaxID=2064 RepID=UPI003855D65C